MALNFSAFKTIKPTTGELNFSAFGGSTNIKPKPIPLGRALVPEAPEGETESQRRLREAGFGIGTPIIKRKEPVFFKETLAQITPQLISEAGGKVVSDIGSFILENYFPIVKPTIERVSSGQDFITAFLTTADELRAEVRQKEEDVKRRVQEAVARGASRKEISEIATESPALQRVALSVVGFLGGIKIVGQKEAQALITQAVKSKLTRQDLIAITRGTLKDKAKLDAFRTMTANPALKKELLEIARNQKISLKQRVSDYLKIKLQSKDLKTFQRKTETIKPAELPTGKALVEAPPIAPKGVSKAITTELQPLAQEARKFKSVEEFAKKLTPEQYVVARIPEIKSIKNTTIKLADGTGGDLTLQKTFDTIVISNINLDKRGTGLGTRIVNALGEFAGKDGNALRTERIRNDEFFRGLGFTSPDAAGNVSRVSPFKESRDIFNKTVQDFYNQAVKGVEPTQPIIKKTVIEPIKITEPKEVKQINSLIKQTSPKDIKPLATDEQAITRITSLQEETVFLKSLAKDIKENINQRKINLKKDIKNIRVEKNLSTTVQSRLKQVNKIKEWNNATPEQLTKVLESLEGLQKGDSFLTDKQIKGLQHYINEGNFGKNELIITKREMIEKFGEKEELLNGVITRYISKTAFPTVDIKDGHPVIRKIVDEADIEMRAVTKQVRIKIEKSQDLMRAAEKSRKQGIFKKDTNRLIFRKMSGEDVQLTEEELRAVRFYQNEFERLRESLNLREYRKNYITNIRQTWLEKLSEKGIFATVKDSFKPISQDIPIDILLALDDIIGSEKFFKFALRREGGLTPSNDIRKIYKEYLNIAETKLALDKILPEAQASQQLLLKDKSALWMKQYLQNLKGRALDFRFRTGDMGWVARTADKIVDIGYIRLLALNVQSAVKNVIGGETNSFVFQPFQNYITGKQRFITNPKKAHKIISEAGLLDGSYVDVVRQNIVGAGKRVTDIVLYGLMQAAEYEIRGSFFLGEMTKAEYKAGTVTPQRFREILDGIAITQGVYTKADSPLFVQTVLGRSMLQFGRWKITNSLLVRRLVNGMRKEHANGQRFGKNTRSILKMLFTASVGMYLAYELGKAGSIKGKKAAQAGAELILTIMDLATGKLIYDALATNPALQTLGAVVFSMQQLANYITFGIVDEPRGLIFQSGIQDMYISALRTLGLQKKKTKIPTGGGTNLDKILKDAGLPSLPSISRPLPKLPALPSL